MSQANHGRLARNTVFLYIRLILILAISLYTSREVLSILGIEDFGIYNVVAGAITMLSFLNGAMTAGTQRFLSFELGAGSKRQLEEVFRAACLLHIGIAAIVVALGETAGLWLLTHILTIPENRMAAAHWIFQLALLTFVMNIVQVPYVATVVANERMGLYAYLSIFEAFVKLVNVYILMAVGADKLILYGILNLMLALLMAGMYRQMCRERFPEVRSNPGISFPKVREMSRFLGWNSFSHMSVAVGVQGVNMLLNIFFGPAMNAARGVAMLASDSIRQLASTVQVASAPQITKTYSAGELEVLKRLILFTCKGTFFLLLVLSIPLLLETEQILHIWLRNPPPESSLFLRLILCDALICTSANPMSYAILATGHIGKYQLLSGVINLSNFGICFALLSVGFPAYTVFCVLIFISVVMLGLRLSFLKRKIEFSLREYGREVLLPGMRVALASMVMPLIVVASFAPGPLRLLLTCIIGLVVTTCSIYVLGLNQQERQFARRALLIRIRRILGGRF